MEKNKIPFVFEIPLIEGVIRKRRNRFIMEVDIDGTIYDCHCPTTGRIGNIVFRDIPCLLSESNDTKRKTRYTVEAISLDLPSEANKSWIGINQNAANRYVEHFLRTGQFSAMVGESKIVKREQKLGISKLDFLVDNTYLEVKTPLSKLQLEMKPHIATTEVSQFNSFERFVKHIKELAESLDANKKAILLTCFIYENPGFRATERHKHSDYIKATVQDCIKRGIDIWQVNFKITPTEVSLLGYFETTDNFQDRGIE